MATRRYHRALLTSAIAVVASLVPLNTATADTSSPTISVTVPESIDLNGPGGDVTVHIANPPSSDAYVQLSLSNGTGLTVTDASGAKLPVSQLPGGGTAFVDLGKVDSNNNGIPGAPLAAGDTTVHVAVAYPGGSSVVGATIVDGATGQVLAATGRTTIQTLVVNGPQLQQAVHAQTPDPLQLHQYGGVADDALDVPVPMLAPPGQFRTSLTFTAAQLAVSGNTAQRVAANLHVTCTVDQQPAQACTWTVNPDGSATLTLPPEATLLPAGGTPHVQFDLHLSADCWLHSGTLTGTLTMRDPAGNSLATAQQSLQVAASLAPQRLTGGLVARDAYGRLWQYRSTGTDTYSPVFGGREYVGPGWNTYNLLASLDGQHGDGTGQLVARDHTGVLWLYQGTGNPTAPFKPRVRVGGGWYIYNTIVGAGDLTADGHPDLLARDHTGVLWLYQGTGNPAAPFKPRVRVGGGWYIYNTIVGAGDLTADGHPDLLARDHTGVLWLYQGTGNPTAPFKPRVRVGGGWGAYSALAGVRDVTDDGLADLVARDSSGVLWLYQGTGDATSPFLPRIRIGTGWNTYNTIV